MSVNIALFDFCETLVSKQTGDGFVEFVLKHQRKTFSLVKFKFYKTKVYWLLSRFLKFKGSKLQVLGLLRDFQYDELDGLAKQYCTSLVKNDQTEIVNIMKGCFTAGNKIIIVSGGYDIYLKYFYPDIVQHVIASKISFTEGKCDGTISGLDCLGLNKIIRIKEIIGKNDFFNNETSFYSDHHSDLPLLLMVDKGIAISKNHPQKWAENFMLEEIILNAND